MAEHGDHEGFAMTVRGPVPVSQLGRSLVHEHLLIDFLENQSLPKSLQKEAQVRQNDTWLESPSLSNYYEMRWSTSEYSHALALRDLGQATEALGLLSQHGGQTIVEVTPIGVGRDPAGLHTLSEASRVTVIMGTGFLTREFQPSYVEKMTERDIASLFASEYRDGIGDLKVRPGIIGEIGLSWPIDDQEARVLRAAVSAQNELGLPLTIHPGRHPSAPLEAVRLVQRAGGDQTRAAIGHLDRTLFTISDYMALAETGVCLELDLFGQESRHYPLGDLDMPNDGGRIAVIVQLFQEGYGDQVLISHDVSSPVRLSANGGEGYHHIFKRVLPVMARRGLSDEEIKMLVVENPARFLAVADGLPPETT